MTSRNRLVSYYSTQLMKSFCQTRTQLLKLTWPRSRAQFEFLLWSAGYLSLTHVFSVTSENITINHITSPKTAFFGLRFCCRRYGSNFNHCDVIGPHIFWFCDLKQKITAITPLRSYKATILGTNGKPVCDFLCANNSNFPFLLSFTVSEIWQITGLIFALSLMHSLRWTPVWDGQIWPQETRNMV